MRFDPRVFINEPYVKCPKCIKATLGVLAIHDRSYERRCTECWLTMTLPLSPLKKSVLYLDQFAISNMMVAIDPQSKANLQGKVDPFWKTLFEKLDLLSKLQVLVCPDSWVHQKESRMTAKYPKLKRLYEQLSQGASFHEIEEIRIAQIAAGVRPWLEGKPSLEIDFDPTRIVHGSLHRWTERLLISVDIPWDDELVEEVRSARDRHSAALNEVFTKWQGDHGKPFSYWLEEERSATGRYPTRRMLKVIQSELLRLGIQEHELNPKSLDYLRSDFLKRLPFVDISAHLYAALARRAASGQKKYPSSGMPNDIDVISAIMPYCDAILLDNECASLLSESPLKEDLSYRTKVFSQKNRDDLLSYLDEIEAQVSEEHRREVVGVYGESWLEPYSRLFSNENIAEESRPKKPSP